MAQRKLGHSVFEGVDFRRPDHDADLVTAALYLGIIAQIILIGSIVWWN
jgi:hypothetical protein